LIKELSAKYKKTPAQIVLNWHLARGVIPLPRSSSVSRLAENLNVYEFVLEAEEVKKINQLMMDLESVNQKNGQVKVSTNTHFLLENLLYS